MRPDGTRVKEASTIVSALPYVMPRRYDAQNFITEYADMEVLRRYIQEKRREGVRIPYMTLILAAYFKAYQENPKINRFIMNTLIDVSSARPSARVFRMTKLTQKWLR